MSHSTKNRKAANCEANRAFEIETMCWMIENTPDTRLSAPQKEALKKAVNRHFRHCPHFADGTKTFCASCVTHCFSKEESAAIKTVMKAAGMKLLLFHPKKAWRHMKIDSVS